MRLLANATAGLAGCLLLTSVAAAQWNPSAGQYLKSDPSDIRVMTWNVQDGICSTNTKTEALNNWSALARIVASLKPDVLLLQETADNNGNGTGGSIDTVQQLETTFDQFLHGGAGVTAWVQKYDPSYDLPYVYVSTANDGFNRNCILSRFPFADLNGDGSATRPDTYFMLADQWVEAAGAGGIRGVPFAEIDLPDGTYAADLVVASAHLKSGGMSSDIVDRRQAAQRLAYFIYYWYFGAQTGAPDPNAKIFDSPMATTVLDPDTLLVVGGDYNEDEQNNGRKGPADWLTDAAVAGGTSDGSDRDGTDMTYDASVTPFQGNRSTQSSSKLDYISWSDSSGQLRRSFVFNTSEIPSGSFPPELIGYTINPALATGQASDHRPVIADFIVAAATGNPCPADLNDDGEVGLADLGAMFSAYGSCPGDGNYNPAANLDENPCITLGDLGALLAAYGPCP